MDLQACLREGYLKKARPIPQEIAKELEEARSDLAQSQATFRVASYKWTIIQAYYAMFHAARAVLLAPCCSRTASRSAAISP